jgi:alkaline phosphatase D
VFCTGDNIYGDQMGVRHTPASPQDLQEQYTLLEQDDEWKDLVEYIEPNPNITYQNIIATYDDHDYGINNGDGTYKYKRESQQLFQNFMKIEQNSYYRVQSGVYNSKVYEIPLSFRIKHYEYDKFTYKVIVLDTRFNKDVKGTVDGDFLGEEQWQWLEHELSDPNPQLFIIGSSIQVYIR